MICPLMTAYLTVLKVDAKGRCSKSQFEIDCRKEKCAWWIRYRYADASIDTITGRCAIVKVAKEEQ